MIASHPFQSSFINAVEIICEFVVVIMSLGMAVFLTDTSDKEDVAVGLICTCLFAVAVYFIVIIRNFVAKCKDRCKKKKEANADETRPDEETNNTRFDTEPVDTKPHKRLANFKVE